MTRVIFKYPIELTDEPWIDMPHGYKVVSVGEDPAANLCLWAEVDPDARHTRTRLRVIGTGHPVPSDEFQYLGTVVQKPFVWHVYIETSL